MAVEQAFEQGAEKILKKVVKKTAEIRLFGHFFREGGTLPGISIFAAIVVRNRKLIRMRKVQFPQRKVLFTPFVTSFNYTASLYYTNFISGLTWFQFCSLLVATHLVTLVINNFRLEIYHVLFSYFSKVDLHYRCMIIMTCCKIFNTALL